ncbi:MAG: peptidase C39 family protein [Armatimonadota bacterium]
MTLSVAAVVCSGCSAAERLFSFSGERAFSRFAMTRAKWDSKTKGVVFHPDSCPDALAAGIVESPEVPVRPGFDHAIISWNASTLPGSYLNIYLQAKIDDQWTPWYRMGLWNRDGRPQTRTSFKGQEDERARVDTDTLILKKPAQALRARVELCTVDGSVYPTLRFLAVSVTDTTKPRPDPRPYRRAWGVDLNVPELCQLSVEGGRPWCSPTSTAMVLGYWARKLKRPELAVGITETAHGVFDEAWGGTGNWTFNTAFAGEFEGIRAYVTRFESISEIERLIAKGVPVIVSLNYNKLNRRKTEVSMGHLMVVRGFTRSGNPIFNDPWAHLDRGQKVRKIFKRADLERAWLGSDGSHGTVYVIAPEKS